MQGNTTASFTTLAIAVLDCHNAVREIALIHVEVKTVHGDEFGKRDIISLFVLVSQVIAEHEASPLARMGVEVHVHQQVVIHLLHDCLLGGPNCWMVLRTRLQVETVEIVGHCVKPVITPRTSIRVEAGNNFENEVFPEQPGLLIFKISE